MMIELRLEGLPADVDAARERLASTFDILSVSKDYPNRDSKLIRRFIKVEVKTGQRLDKDRLTWLVSQLLTISHAEVQATINIPDTLAAYHAGYQAGLMELARSAGIVPDADAETNWLAKLYDQILTGKLTEAKLAEANNPPAPKRKTGRKKQQQQGFWLETEVGPVHVLGNPDRANDPEFKAAVEAMAKAAKAEASRVNSETNV